MTSVYAKDPVAEFKRQLAEVETVEPEYVADPVTEFKAQLAAAEDPAEAARKEMMRQHWAEIAAEQEETERRFQELQKGVPGYEPPEPTMAPAEVEYPPAPEPQVYVSPREEVPVTQGVRFDPATQQIDLEYEPPELPSKRWRDVAWQGLARGALNTLAALDRTVARVHPAKAPEFHPTADWAEAVLAEHPEWSPIQVRTASELIANPKALLDRVAEMIPYASSTIIATLLGGPKGGLAIAGAIAYAVEGDSAYQDALQAGASHAEASKEGDIVGVVNAVIELAQVSHAVSFIRGGRRALAQTIAGNVMKASKRGVAKQALRMAAREGIEEALQGMVQEGTAFFVGGRAPEGGIGAFIDRRMQEALPAALGFGALGLAGRAAAAKIAPKAEPPAPAPVEPAPVEKPPTPRERLQRQLEARKAPPAVAEPPVPPSKPIVPPAKPAPAAPAPPVAPAEKGPPTRVRYQKGSFSDAIAAARRLQSESPLYLVPTAEGIQMERREPPKWQRHAVVAPDGSVKMVEPPSEVVKPLTPEEKAVFAAPAEKVEDQIRPEVEDKARRAQLARAKPVAKPAPAEKPAVAEKPPAKKPTPRERLRRQAEAREGKSRTELLLSERQRILNDAFAEVRDSIGAGFATRGRQAEIQAQVKAIDRDLQEQGYDTAGLPSLAKSLRAGWNELRIAEGAAREERKRGLTMRVEEPGKRPEIKDKTLRGFIADEAGELDVREAARLLRVAESQVLRIVEPAKLVERALGKDVYARVIRAMHMPESEALRWKTQKIRGQADLQKMTREELMAECDKRGIFYKKDFKKPWLVRALEEQRLPELADATYDQLRDYLGKFSPKELENIMLARGNPGTAEGQGIRKLALESLPGELKQALGPIQEIADFNYKLLQKVAGAEETEQKAAYVEDYFYGVYKNPQKARRFLDHYRTTKRFLKKKVFPTYADAYAYGLRLRDANPVDNLLREFMAISRLHQMNQLRDDLLATGREKYIIPSDAATFGQRRDWEEVKDPTFKDMLVDPDLARLIDNLIAVNKITQIKPLAGWRKMNAFLRSIKFIGSGFHLGVVAKQGVVDSGPLGFLKPWRWPRIKRQVVSRGFKKGDPIFGTPEYRQYIALGGGHRYSIESEAQQMVERWLTSKEYGRLWRTLRLPARVTLDVPRRFVNWMFNSYIPKLKYAKHLEQKTRAEQKLGRELTDAEEIDIIKEGQNFYGMMNERLFGRSGTATSALRFIFLAPGFGEGNYRTMAKALLHWRKGGPTGGATRSRWNIPQSLLFTAMCATVGTLILTGEPPDMPTDADTFRDLFKIKTPWKDEKDRTVYVDLLTYDKDYWQQMVYPTWKLVTGHPEEAAEEALVTFVKRIGHMKAPTLGILSDLYKMASGEALVDWKGQRVYYITDPFLLRLNKVAVHWWHRAEPIPTSVALRMMARKTEPVVAIITAAMGIRPAYSEHDKRVNELVRDTYSLRQNQEELYYKLGQMWHPREAIKEYNEIVARVEASPYMTDEIREELKKRPLRINVDRLLANKVWRLGQPNLEKDKRKRIVAYLRNFGIGDVPEATELLRLYYWKFKKPTLRVTARRKAHGERQARMVDRFGREGKD